MSKGITQPSGKLKQPSNKHTVWIEDAWVHKLIKYRWIDKFDW